MAQSIMDMTWADFLSGLEKAGVTVETLATGEPYLLRMALGEELTIPLPTKHGETDLVGCHVFWTYCRRLKVDTSTYFKGWHFVL